MSTPKLTYENTDAEIAKAATEYTASHSAHCAVATGSEITPYPSSLPQNTRAPQWWYSCFQQGHHDMSIYEIEWAYDAFLRFFPNIASETRRGQGPEQKDGQ